ncbi:MAG: bifunctional sulfate adenylyltransferase/adenylylsulfate kinase [Legionellaceae bacterium]|nr:bifunctional sulfate adenylyltransferase/adenylylsulfate kinase [Legionellaceae bacterium]
MNSQWIVTNRQRYDIEMLLNNAFSPLTGFLSQADYESVLTHSRLANNHIWPIPITLDVSEDIANKVIVGETINLYDVDNTLLARMNITDKWRPDKGIEAEKIFGTDDKKHPGVDYLFNTAGAWYLGGPLEPVNSPKYHDFTELRHTPNSLKQLFSQLGWTTVIGFQTRNPIHRAHMELMLKAAVQVDGNILIHPVVGLTKPGDIDYFTRVRCYQTVLRHYPVQSAVLSLLPLAMRMAGPREALWHALIRKNYGCTHFIVGRDHAGPGNNTRNQPFYEPYAAQEFVSHYAHEIGIKILPFQEMVYVKERRSYSPIHELKSDETPLTISGTQLRTNLLLDQPIPDWFSFPDIIQLLREAYPSRNKQGFTLFFTGLSGSGKSTLAQALMAKIMSHDKRSVSILDGDIVRHLLADKLGFSQADRDLNIRIISYIASEITKAGGIAICAAIAPYQNARQQSRQLIAQQGGFIEIYNATPLETCEKRDTKGLYAKARAGKLKHFTGIDDIYEAPKHPDITLDTSNSSVDESVANVMHFLCDAGYLNHSVIQDPPNSKKGVAHCEAIKDWTFDRKT